jgi:hypothetical protein
LPARLSSLDVSDVTKIIDAIGAGDPHAASQLLPLVYAELRQEAAPSVLRKPPSRHCHPERSEGSGIAPPDPSLRSG